MSRITDLEVTGWGYHRATLTWESLGADPSDFPCDARYLTAAEMGGLEEITEVLYAVADTVAGEPLPSGASVVESLMVSGLIQETEYYMAVRTARHSDGEMSDISNTVHVTTDAAIQDCSYPGLAIPDNNSPGVDLGKLVEWCIMVSGVEP